jgi:hypothetical protein
MISIQVEYSVKMANDHKSNVTWSTTLCIYLLHTHPSIYLTTYLLPTHPPTYPLFPYLLIPFHLLIYVGTYIFSPLYNPLIP